MEDLAFIENLKYAFNSEGVDVPYIFVGIHIEEVVQDLLNKVEEQDCIVIWEGDWCIQVDKKSMCLSWGVMNSDCFELFTALKKIYSYKQTQAKQGFAETYLTTRK